MNNASNDMSAEDLKLFVELVYKKTGIKMGPEKKALLVNRLAKRMRALKIETYSEYYKFLTSKASDKDVQDFIDSVTTNETYFFRTPAVWDYFSKQFLPEWFAANKGKSLKLWCAASSSGEEPYTIGLLCTEFAEKNPGFTWSLVASDISEEMLRKCQAGTYSGRSIEHVSPARLKKYFQSDDGTTYKVASTVKSNIRFIRHNLLEKPKQSQFDLIFIRNVMIYFDVQTKEKILAFMEESLKNQSVLVIGESEGMVGVKTGFKYQCPSIYKKAA